MLPDDTGAIIRTSAENITENDIKADIERLLNIWENICNEPTDKIPRLVYKTGGILNKILIDLIDNNLDKIVVDSNGTKQIVEEILNEIKSNNKVNIEINENRIDGDIEKQIQKSENRKIWLKCGGFITIDKTEALTAIDVNSGKYIGEENLEKTIFTVNK